MATNMALLPLGMSAYASVSLPIANAPSSSLMSIGATALLRWTLHSAPGTLTIPLPLQRCRLACAQEGFENLDVLVRFLVGRQMPALLEEHQLRAGNGMRHVPGRQGRDVHVVAARDHQGGEPEAGQFR